MSDATANIEEAKPQGRLKAMLVLFVLAFLGAGAGYSVSTGMVDVSAWFEPSKLKGAKSSVAFIPIDPMTVSIGPPADRRFLKFGAQLEVPAKHSGDVAAMMPRIVDVLNTYLRSITMADVEDPAALLTLRSQMRRRVDLVVGGDKVRDLLVMEFVVN